MTKRLRKRRFILGVCILLMGGAFTYGYTLPTLLGAHYLKRLDSELVTLNTALMRMADTSNLSQFADPDASLDARIDQTAQALSQAQVTRVALDTFGEHVDDLPLLPFVEWVGDYQRALIKREQAKRVVLQSREVLTAYEQMLVFMAGYTPLQRSLDERLDSMSVVDDFDTMGGRGSDVAAMASAIRIDAEILRNLAVPKDLTALHKEALQTFDQAAAAFDHLAFGLDIAVNSEIYGADAEITAAALKNKTTDKNLLVALTDVSPTFLRLSELPEKIDYVER